MAGIRDFFSDLRRMFFRNMTPTKAATYTGILRFAYLFSSLSLVTIVYQKVKENSERKFDSDMIIDKSPAHRRLRLENRDVGVIFRYDPDQKKVVREDYNKELYYQELENEAMKRRSNQNKTDPKTDGSSADVISANHSQTGFT